MRDRSEQLLRWLGCILIALICFQVLRAGCRANPFARLHLPPVPTLQTNAVANAATNVAPNQPNQPPSAGAPTTHHAPEPGTNSLAVAVSTNAPTSSTNVVTNAITVVSSTVTTNLTAESTNSPVETNTVAAGATNGPTGTNTLAAVSTNAAGTNIVRSVGPPHPPRGGPMIGGMPFMGGGFPGMPGMGGPPTPLPKEIQARVDKIVDSEIFAPVMRPQPMQLFGIAGSTALLRTASGESGLVKEGDSLGSVKLLRIGINRVLVDDNGQTKELMIFDGYGGESLMPKTNEVSK